MNTLNFDTGVVKHSINGKYELEFNPTDIAFAERLGKAFDELEKKQEGKRKALESAETSQIFDLSRAWDAEMREIIDGVFGGPLCASVFGDTSVFALANGLPLWTNLLLAIMDEMDAAIIREKRATDPRIQKYTKKYHK